MRQSIQVLTGFYFVQLKLAPGSPKDLTPKLENGVLQYSPSARLILIPRSTQI
jgi:hypothetical protein